MEDFLSINETIREAKYKSYTMKSKDPYGFIVIDGIDGQFTTFDEARKFIDAKDAAKATLAKLANSKKPAPTKD